MKNNAKGGEIKLNIADIVVAVRGRKECLFFRESDPHQYFVASEGTPDLSLEISFEPIPGETEDGFQQKLFESGGLWTLYGNAEGYLISLSSSALGPVPYKTAVIDRDFTHGVIYCGGLGPEKCNLTHILEYPLLELVFVNLLSQGRGVEVHACGLVDETGQGHLFIGRSGAGKSTLAKLWQLEKDITILSDDRIIIRKRNGGFEMFGTPWHGEAGVCAMDSAPLKAVYLLAKAPSNEVRPLDRIVAASRLFQCCFPSFYDGYRLEYSTTFFDEMTQKVSCQELRFLPERSAVDYIRSLARTVSRIEGTT